MGTPLQNSNGMELNGWIVLQHGYQRVMTDMVTFVKAFPCLVS